MSRRAPVQRLALVGNMGAGKTQVARRVAELISLPFSDLDALVELRLGHRISQAFEAHGEAAFRVEELNALRGWLDETPNGVLALGGGTFAQAEARAALREAGVTTVYLRLSPDLAWTRIVADGVSQRPMVANAASGLERLRALHAERDPVYRSATHTIDGDADVEDVARALVAEVYGHA